MHSLRWMSGFALGLFLLLTSSAHAGKHPHDRNGFMIGFGIGGGTAGIEAVDGREGGGTGNFRIGYAVRNDLVVHFEGAAWGRRFDNTLVGDVTWRLSTATVAVSWYPSGAGGLFVRGGLGFGRADVEIVLAAAGGSGGSVGNIVKGQENGVGLIAALGYEWRLTRKFALGPQLQLAHQGYNNDNAISLGWSNVVDLSLNFNWYW